MNNLLDIIARSDTFLLDASGVIYCDFTPIPGVQNAIAAMQAKGAVFVVTNNSFQDPVTISKSLESMGITIASTHIISSGHGLEHDESMNVLVKDKNVFVFGAPTSYPYIYQAHCKNIVSTPEEADCIVMTSSYKDHTETLLDSIANFLKKNPHIPTICCNPDRLVRTKHGLKPVIGFFAEKLSQTLGIDLHWIGKPYKNFSYVTKKLLEKEGITLSKTVCFFDDNIENVQALQSDLGISGCLVKETGLAKDLDTPRTKIPTDFIIPSLSE